MKKLFAAVPVLALIGASMSASCGNGDQGTGNGTGNATGVSGSGNPGSGGGGNVAGAPAGGAPAGTSGAPNGTGGAPTGTAGTSPGTGDTAGGPAASGGAPNTAGAPSTGGTTGSGTAGSGTAGSGPANLLAVASVLNGQMLLGPCKATAAASVCDTRDPGAACPVNADRALAGVLTTDRTVTLGGTAGQQYTITLHIQGEVESKQYPGGVDQNSTLGSPRADGFAVGGTPSTNDNYNVYMIRVTNPGATTHTDYFLNSLQAPGVSNHTTYGIDYTTGPIRAQGGASIRLVAGDSNCQMIKNCGPMVNDGSVCAAPIILANVEPEAMSLNPTFNFNTAYNGQWISMVVKTVTSP